MKTSHLISLFALATVFAGCSREQALPVNGSKPIGGVEPIQLTDANFQIEVLQSDLPVLVDMWAPWCQPCMAMKPMIRQLAEQFAGQVKVAELNVEDNPFITEKYDVDRYPMLLIFVDGREVHRLVGRQSKEELALALQAQTTQETHE